MEKKDTLILLDIPKDTIPCIDNIVWNTHNIFKGIS